MPADSTQWALFLFTGAVTSILMHSLRMEAKASKQLSRRVVDQSKYENAIVDALAEGSLRVDDLGFIQSIDERAAAILGIDRATIPISIDEIPSEINRQALAHSIQEGYQPDLDVCDKKSNKWYAILSVSLEDHTVLFLRDVTERRRREQAFQRLAEEKATALRQLESLLENAPIGFAFFDRSHHFLRVNSKMAEATRYSADEHVGRSLRAVLGEAIAERIDGLIDEVFQSGRRISGAEIVAPVGDGSNSERTFLAYFFPVHDRYGSVASVGAVLTEVTDRLEDQLGLRRSEARLRLLIESTGADVWSTSPNGLMDAPQESWQAFTGQGFGSSQEEGWQNAIHPEDRRYFQSAHRQSIRSKQPLEIVVRLWNQKYDSFRYCDLRLVPVFTKENILREWAGLVRDVHEERMLAEERERLLSSERAARSEAEKASRMKDEFVATLSHELRTPLTAIQGWVDVLKRSASDPDILATAVGEITNAVHRQKRMIEDLLDLSRIAVGRLELNEEHIDLGDLIGSSVRAIRPRAESKDIELTWKEPSDMFVVLADEARLEQVVMNLLSNAVKFTPEGGHIRVSLTHGEGDKARLEVEDDGEGIAPEFLPNMFDRFRQANSAITRRHGGLGLGLSIVKNLVELHGGSVEAYSEGKDKGSRFTVELPLSLLHPDELIHEAPTTTALDSSFLEGLRILLVDDDAATLQVLSMMLVGEKAHVITAESAPEAYSKLQKHLPDVLLSDIGMPEEDGFRFIRRVRMLTEECGGRVPAIAITAFARLEDRTMAEDAGFDGFVTKPVLLEDLVAELYKSLQKRGKLTT